MNRAAILVFCISLWLPLNAARVSGQQTSQQSPQAASGSSASQIQTPAQPQSKPKPSAAKPKHRKSSTPPDCANAPAAVKPASDSGEPAKAAGAEGPAGSGAGNSGDEKPPQSGSPAPDSTGSAPANPAPAKPCPPPKKVVRNGGSSEPAIQLLPETSTAQQSEQQRAIDQLLAATEENLKKIAGHQLTASQQDTVSQIKQFIEQSKKAAAAGDMERARNLAEKAKLLSEELVKP